MWNHAVAAIFTNSAYVVEVTAALVTQRVKWTVAKKAIEIVGIISRMAWEKLAILVTKKLGTIFVIGIIHKNPISLMGLIIY